MNETRDIPKLLERWGHLPLAELPAEVREQVLASEACREAFARNERLVALLALKRHELPDPAYEGRLLHRIRTRLENSSALEPVDPSELGAGHPRLWLRTAPFAIAAALAVAAGLSLLRSPVAEPAPTPSLAVSAPAPANPAPLAAGLTDEQVRRIFAVEKTTNGLQEFIAANHLEHYELVNAPTNRIGTGLGPIPDPLVPVKALPQAAPSAP